MNLWGYDLRDTTIISLGRECGANRIAVGATATVIVTPEAGQPVRMQHRAHVEAESGDQSAPNYELQPGESSTGFISWWSDWLFEDAAVTKPGKYEIALELSGDPNEPEEGTSYVGTLRSEAAKLIRIQPIGDDALVWARLQEGQRDEGSLRSDGLANRRGRVSACGNAHTAKGSQK